MGPMAKPVISSGRFGSLYSGTRSIKGSSEITTAEAWTEACRVHPSRVRATPQSSPTRGSRLTCSASAGAFSSASSSVMLRGKAGTSFAIRSASPKEKPITRATSRITALAPIVPKVMMWATRSAP